MKIKELKKLLKQLSEDIRKEKAMTKQCQRTGTSFKEVFEWKKAAGYGYWDNLSERYRYHHIAYCLLRGRKYEQIENKVKQGNEPKWSRIESVMQEYREVDQIECSEVIGG